MSKWNNFVNESTAIKIEDLRDVSLPPLVRTASIQKDISLVKPLLDNNESFILVGPEGCGKHLLIRSLVNKMKQTQIAIIHCNAQT
jgi:dynein heavy chain 2